MASDSEKLKRDNFTTSSSKKFRPSFNDIGVKLDLWGFFDDTDTPNFNPYVDNEGIEEPTMPEADEIADYDRYIESEVLLPRNGEELSSAKVISRVKDKNGKVKGSYNKNPILDTRVYDVMFPDGTVSQYAANVITFFGKLKRRQRGDQAKIVDVFQPPRYYSGNFGSGLGSALPFDLVGNRS